MGKNKVKKRRKLAAGKEKRYGGGENGAGRGWGLKIQHCLGIHIGDVGTFAYDFFSGLGSLDSLSRSPEILAPRALRAFGFAVASCAHLAWPESGVLGRVEIRIRKVARDDVREGGHEAVGVVLGDVTRGVGEVTAGLKVWGQEGSERILDILVFREGGRVNFRHVPVIVVGNRPQDELVRGE